jgi:hypothetical protein
LNCASAEWLVQSGETLFGLGFDRMEVWPPIFMVMVISLSCPASVTLPICKTTGPVARQEISISRAKL